jgi:two-component system alkaline phosphatase synthesis response regulator PhoP
MSSTNSIKKIVVIEDNPTIVELITYAINLQGTYHVVVACDGASVFLERPDGVIIDMKVPKRDAYHLVSSFRAQTQMAPIPLLLLSAIPREEDPMAALLIEGDGYLTKPFPPHALSAAVERLLRHCR